MAELRVDLDSTIRTWPGFASQNIAHIGDGWQVARALVELHGLALQRVSQASGRKPTQQEEMVLLLGTHGLNLFLEVMSMIARGRFDVAPHLLRALMDCQSLAFAIHSDESTAQELTEGKLRGSHGRKKVVEAIRTSDPELADFLDHRYREEADSANELTHVNLAHLDKVLERNGTSITPIVGGRIDHELAPHMAGAAIEHEEWHVSWFAGFHADKLGEVWLDQYQTNRRGLRTWMKHVYGASGYNAETNAWDNDGMNATPGKGT